MSYPQTFITVENEPRKITVIGRSSFDPDVVVGYLASDKARKTALWLMDDGNDAKEVVPVIGLDKPTRAIRLPA